MGSNGSKQKKAQAIGEFSSSYQRNRAEHDQNTETPRNEEPRREKPEPKKLKREEPKKEQPKRDPELIVMSNTKKERKHVREKPKMETVQADPSVDIDFTNTSNETVYVFITEKGREKQCVLELQPLKSASAKLPKGSEFQAKDLYEDFYFSSVADDPKVCFIPSSPIDDMNEQTSVRLFNKSEHQATVRTVPNSSISRKLGASVLSEISFISEKSDLFIQPKQDCLIQILADRDETVFELMSANKAQHFEINEDFTDMIALEPPNEVYSEASFLGFLLMLPESLLNKNRNKDLFDAFRTDFDEMIRLLPSEVVGLMRRVALYVNKDSSDCVTGLCFHRDRNWLGLNNEPFEKYGAVEIRNVDQYLQIRSGNSPACLLHEYAHAYYFFTLELNQALIQYTYENTLEKGQYMSLANKRPHYAMTDCEEYFAECTVAFFSSRLFRATKYPKDCLQLRAFDVGGFEMCEKVYNVFGDRRQRQYLDDTRELYKNEQY